MAVYTKMDAWYVGGLKSIEVYGYANSTTPTSEYNITLADGSSDHGTVAFSVGGTAATKAEAGDVVTVTVTPEEGNTANEVTARAFTSWNAAGTRHLAPTPQLVGDITVTKQADGTWLFTMPEANVWVEVSYVNKTELGTAIDEAKQYYESIKDSNPDAAQTLLDAITAAEQAKDKQGATQEEIDNALGALGTAKENTEQTVLDETKDELDSAIQEAEAYYESIKDTNPEAASTLKEAIELPSARSQLLQWTATTTTLAVAV